MGQILFKLLGLKSVRANTARTDLCLTWEVYSTGQAPSDGASGAQHGAPVSFIIAARVVF